MMFDFAMFPVLYTKRLRLDAITEDDTQAVYDLFSDEDVTRYNDVQTFTSKEDARWLMQFLQARYKEHIGLRWALRLREAPRKLIGTVGFNVWVRGDQYADVGYDLLPFYWKRGLMTEALGAVIYFGFEQMALHRIEAQVDVLNPASARVLEKHGFTQDGILRQRAYWKGQFHDMAMLSLLRHEWEASIGEGA